MGAVSKGWLEIETAGGTIRTELKPGLTRVGGAGADVGLVDPPRGELHFWDDPPKLVYIGPEPAPTVDGEPVEERPLRPGDVVRWAGATLRYGAPAAAEPAPAVLEELPPERASAARGAVSEGGGAAWTRVRAGMLADLGLADRKATRRWQDAVLRGEFDPDACARDLLAGSSVQGGDARLLERSARLLRDFLMTPLATGSRGAARRMRGAAKSGTAFVVAQGIVILIYTAILGTMMVLARLKWGWSFDELFDRVLGR
jgi:hypothetical protein